LSIHYLRGRENLSGFPLTPRRLTWLLWPYSRAVSYSFYYLAIVGAALYGGWRPGALAVVAGAVAGDYLFIRPYQGSEVLEAHLAVFHDDRCDHHRTD
jgi:Domain of unknown function (DUF4118)